MIQLLQEYFFLIQDFFAKTQAKFISIEYLGIDLEQWMCLFFVTVSLVFIALTLLHKPPKALSSTTFQFFTLSKIQQISHDTKRLTFKLPRTTDILGLPIGQHISLMYLDENEKQVIRSYTPTTGDECPGIVTFVIKIYKANVNERFPDGGKMTQFLDNMRVGDGIEMRGPKGHLTYKGQGKFSIAKTSKKALQNREANHFGMIAGGTGITPMLQIISEVLLNHNTGSDKKTKVSLLYANQTEEDILLRDEIEELQRQFPDRFNVYYTIDRKTNDAWKYNVGFINDQLIKDHLPAPGKGTQIFMCGPPPMIKFACLPNLEKLGHKEDATFVF